MPGVTASPVTKLGLGSWHCVGCDRDSGRNGAEFLNLCRVPRGSRDVYMVGRYIIIFLIQP